MFSIVHSGGLSGIHSYLANIEVDVSSGLPAFNMVGRLSGEVKEARERVRVALRNCGIAIPPSVITVNISPANIIKYGTAFDLPIALGILISLNQIPGDSLTDILIVGELGLDGKIQRVNGVLPIILTAKASGYSKCIVPLDNYSEARYVDGIEIIPTGNIPEVIEYLQTGHTYTVNDGKFTSKTACESLNNSLDFSDIVGQQACKRAALIAASGFHHLLITGPPGAGKTMIAKRIPGIMPPLTSDESLEVSTIYSVAGLLNDKTPYVFKRTFQSPHHTVTRNALAGGGHHGAPGILCLSHRGVLFLDELPEFSRECLEVLREPLEDKKIQISRLGYNHTYPADFMLVAAANPCPCGFYPNRNKCNCSDPVISRYRSKISGPIRDRIDIIVSAEPVTADNLIMSSKNSSDIFTTGRMQKMVLKAHDIQLNRFKNSEIRYNSDIPSSQLEHYCPLGPQEKDYVRELYSTLNLSARSFHKLLKVSRTIADLDCSNNIEIRHLAEAVCYRG